MTRDEVLRIVREAQGRGERPNLRGANLSEANLHGANLRGANLSEANLHGANLSGANLRWANLHGANLSGANLRWANLIWANLYGANLYGANLCGADLRGANLSEANLIWANLCGADLRGANLSEANLSEANLRGANLSEANLIWANLIWANLNGARGEVLAIDGLPSGPVRLIPTLDGWSLRIGCWGDGTATYGPAALRDLIAGTDWPEAEGDEQDRRRPGLAAVADLCDAHAAANPDLIANLAKRWGTDKAVLS
jgi:uncharacterized protein YjbI with pentapeptide repeats